MTAEPTSYPGAPPEPLRVALELDSLLQPAWIHRMVADVQRSEIADIVLVVLSQSRPGAGRPPGMADGPAARLYPLYAKADQQLFGSAGAGSGPRLRARGEAPAQDACGLVDLGPCLAGVDRLEPIGVDLAEGEGGLAQHRVDFTIRLGEGQPSSTGNGARYGTLAYRHGAGTYAEGPPGFWEVMDAAPVTTSTLELWREGTDRSVAVCRAATGTDNYSMTRNLNGHLWTCSAFVLRFLRQVHDGHVPAPGTIEAEPPLPYAGRRRGVPADATMVRLLARHAARVAVDRIEHLLRPQRWVLAYSLGDEPRPLHDFDVLVPPEARVWADPFPVVHDGRHYLFFEEQDTPVSPGHISVIALGDDGSWTESTPVIRADYHLSYPCIFRWDDSFYMVPESGEARRIELYRCTDFPTGWVFDRVLVDGIRGVDTTVAEVDGRWWMFVNTGEEGAQNCEELSLFTAPAPIGPWVPHAGNPVSSDARRTRPAGQIIEWRGRLLRPSQDSGGRYGRAVVVNEILRLDDACFKETEIFRIEADWDPAVARIHSLNMVPGLTVVDLMIRERRGGAVVPTSTGHSATPAARDASVGAELRSV